MISFPVEVTHYREYQECYRRASMDWFSSGLQDFTIGCAGALAPESWRLYNLRTNPRLRWSLGYVSCTIPFLVVGGFIAWALEPTTKWAAFYSGLTAPILLTAAMKDTAKSQKELEDIESELEAERTGKAQIQKDLVATQQQLAEENALLRKQLNDLLPEDKKLPTKTRIKISFGSPPHKNVYPWDESSEEAHTEYRDPQLEPPSRSVIRRNYSYPSGLLWVLLLYIAILFSLIFKTLTILTVITTIIGIIALAWFLYHFYQKAKKSKAFQNFLSGLF